MCTIPVHCSSRSPGNGWDACGHVAYFVCYCYYTYIIWSKIKCISNGSYTGANSPLYEWYVCVFGHTPICVTTHLLPIPSVESYKITTSPDHHHCTHTAFTNTRAFAKHARTRKEDENDNKRQKSKSKWNKTVVLIKKQVELDTDTHTHVVDREEIENKRLRFYAYPNI